jgi:hypothetical protein
MHVTEATRGHITVQCEDKSVTVYGEMFGKSPGMPDYQIYGFSIKHWDAPHDALLITEEEKKAILTEVCDYLKHHGRTPVVLEE